MTTSLQSYRVSFFKWAMWLLAALYFCYDVLLRVYPSMMINDLAQAFKINDEFMGFIDSLYFYTYAFMQLPVGILLDRYGAGKMLPIAASVSGIASILYGLAPAPWVIAAARLIGGLGTSFAFIGLLYISVHWFPKKHLALLFGVGCALGGAGNFLAEGPIALLLKLFDWRIISIWIGIFGIILGIFFYIISHFKPKELILAPHAQSFIQALKGLHKILRNPQSWLNTFTAFFIYATTTGFSFFWGKDFLQNAHHLSAPTAGFLISMIAVGWVVGCPVIGYLSDRSKKRRLLITWSSLLAFFALSPVVYILDLNLVLMFILLFFVGFFTTVQLQNYTLIVLLNDIKDSGTAGSCINFVGMLGGSFFQFFAGFMLNAFWSGHSSDGIQVFSANNWKIAMTIFPITFLIAFFLSFFLKEIYHEKRLS